MTTNTRAMIAAITLAAVIFQLAKPIALQFSSAEDFSRRRNIWFALTIIGFLSPNFWIFALAAVPLFFWAGRKDSNPIAFYLLLLHVVPPIGVDIPVVGINQLFPLDNYRLLSFCVLIPTALRFRKSKQEVPFRGSKTMDTLLLAFGIMQIALFIQPDLPGHVFLSDSPTNVLRRAFLFYIDVYVLYYAVSRSCSNRKALTEAMAALCLSCAVLAAAGLFESMRKWLLYGEFAHRWAPEIGGFFYFFYTFRGSSLRAQVSSGHPLALGYLIAIAFGCWLYLRTFVKNIRSKIAVFILWLAGLWGSYSRGPLIGTVAIYFSNAAMSPGAARGVVRGMVAGLLLIAALSVTPLGDRIGSVLPLGGQTIDSETIIYRQRLATRSWELIQQHPFFGDPYVYSKMDDLRQGMGIVDLVNTYAEIALMYGLVGLSLFLGAILVGCFKTYRLTKQVAPSDRNLALMGASLTACVLGTLTMIATTSFILGYEKLFYVLTGFTAAYIHLARPRDPR